MKIDITIKNSEQIGILTEKYISEYYNIKYNYNRADLPENEELKNDIFCSLKVIDKPFLIHTGYKNECHDFIDNQNKTVSIKTSIKNNKVCPQNIGQTTLKYFNCDTNIDFKKIFYNETHKLLNNYLINLFICDIIVFYNFKKGKMYYIKKSNENISLRENIEYFTSQTIESWKNSNTIKINLNNKKITIGDIQIHSSRPSITFRFHFDELLILINSNYINGLIVKEFDLKNKYNINIPKNSNTISNKLFPTITYIGCKTKLVDTINFEIEKYTGKKINEFNSFFDCFSGTGTVSYYMLKKGVKNVISNDIQYYSYILNTLTDNNIDIPKLEKIIYNINTLQIENPSQKDFIYNNYSISRMYFTQENALKIDRIRQYIEVIYINKIVNYNEYKFLIKMLLHSANKVSNITSVYGAYLKNFKASALKTIEFDNQLINYLIKDNHNHIVYNNDIFDIIKKKEGTIDFVDIAYIDSPYNQRNYDSNYHLMETIALYDYPQIYGKTGLRTIKNLDCKKFCSKTSVKLSFIELIENIKCKYCFISYNNESLINKEEMLEILQTKCSNVICVEIPYVKFNSDIKNKKMTVIEYLFCCTK